MIRESIAQTVARGKVCRHRRPCGVAFGGEAGPRVPDGCWSQRRLQPELRVSPSCYKGSTSTRAAREVKGSDAARRDYLKRFYGIDAELPTHYDLVVNTDVLSIDQAADLITHAAIRSEA